MFLQNGTADAIAPPDGAKWLFQSTTSLSCKQLHLLNVQHDLLTGVESSLAIQNICAWTEERLRVVTLTNSLD